MDYRWKVVKLYTVDGKNDAQEVLNDAVVTVKWQKIGTSFDGESASYLGTTNLSYKDTPLENFIDFSSLDEQIVITWVQDTLTDQQKSMIDSQIIQKINKKRVIERTPPWKA